LGLLHFYKNNKNCVISKILIERVVNGIKVINDVTSFRDKPTSALAIDLKYGTYKKHAESTHIRDGHLVNANVTIIITTLNKENDMPVLANRNDFLKELFDEWAGQW
jgi:hypothetical protein